LFDPNNSSQKSKDAREEARASVFKDNRIVVNINMAHIPTDSI